MSGNNTFSIVHKYHTLGRYVMPSGGGRNGKSALIEWKPYQAIRPTDTQLHEWQSKLNLAFVQCLRQSVTNSLPFDDHAVSKDFERGRITKNTASGRILVVIRKISDQRVLTLYRYGNIIGLWIEVLNYLHSNACVVDIPGYHVSQKSLKYALSVIRLIGTSQSGRG